MSWSNHMSIRWRLLVCVALLVLGGRCDVKGDDAQDDLREVMIPKEAVEAEYAFRPMGDIVKGTKLRVGGEVVGERRYYSSGVLAEEKIYQEEKLHGYQREFYPNGKLFGERPYRNGVMDGRFRFFDETGKLLGESDIRQGTGLLKEFGNPRTRWKRSETPYVKGEIHGIEIVWGAFEGSIGKAMSFTEFKAGSQEGWQYTYDEDGTLLSSVFTVHGLVHGYWYHKDRKGNDIPAHAGYWLDGKKVSKQKFTIRAKGDKVLMETLEHKPPTLVEMQDRVLKSRETR